MLVTQPTHPPRWEDLMPDRAAPRHRRSTVCGPCRRLLRARLARQHYETRNPRCTYVVPYLVALALTCGSSAKTVLHRIFMLHDALPLLDYDNEQRISDFKMLMSCYSGRGRGRGGSLMIGGGDDGGEDGSGALEGGQWWAR
jgi:condensin-2 complex subunit G2